jgi:hypothetical protein
MRPSYLQAPPLQHSVHLSGLLPGRIASKPTSFGGRDGSVGAGGRCTGIRIQPAERAAHTDDRGSRCGPSEVARRLRRVRRAQQPSWLGRCEKHGYAARARRELR